MDTVMTGIIPLFSAHARVLFDLGSMHSFGSGASAYKKNKKIVTIAWNYLTLSYYFLPLLIIF